MQELPENQTPTGQGGSTLIVKILGRLRLWFVNFTSLIFGIVSEVTTLRTKLLRKQSSTLPSTPELESPPSSPSLLLEQRQTAQSDQKPLKD